MNWLIPFFVITAVLVVLEAIYFIRQGPDRVVVRRLGIFSLALVLLASMLFGITYDDGLVFSPEFGVLMGHDSLARYAMQAMIVLIAVVAGLAWNVMRVSSAMRRRLLLVALGVLVGLVAASRVTLLNEDEPAAPLISAYDVWWPPLTIWIAVCIADLVVLTLGVGIVTVRLLAAMGTVAAVAIAASRQPLLLDPHSAAWTYVVLIGVPFALIFGLWLGASTLAWMVWVKTLRLALAVAAVGVLVSMAFSRVRATALPMMTSPWAWMLMLVLIVIPVLVVVLAERRAPAAGRLGLPSLSLRRWLCAAAGALLLIALALPSGLLSAATSVSFALAAWLFTSDVIVHGPISSPAGAPFDHLPIGTWLNPRVWIAGVAQGGPYLAAAQRSLASIVSVPTAWAVVGKGLLGLVLLIAVSEVVNSGKSIIQPFTVSAPAAVVPKDGNTKEAKEAQSELGRAIGDRAVNTIGQLRQELKTDVLFVPRGANRRPAQIVGTTASTAGIDAALEKSSEIDVWNVKIPLSLLVAPVQTPVRAALGVRIVSGVVQVDGQQYVLLAASNAGDSWRVDVNTGVPSDAIKVLGDQLAFRLLTNVDSSLRAANMTSSWEAFQAFRSGLEGWRQYQAEPNLTVLSKVIQYFRDASLRDGRFALAHYWLGLALQEDGQRASAADAFRRSITLNPDFAAGYLALAVALSNAPIDYPAAVGPADEELQAQNARAAEARWRLHQFISFPPGAVSSLRDRGVAYAALCRDAYQRQDDTANTGFYVAYFYCARAKAAYARLDPDGRSDVKSREAEADIENETGVLLQRVMGAEVEVEDWQCGAIGADAKSIDDSGQVGRRRVSRGPFTRSALKKYARAIALADNTVYRCNYALAAYSLGQEGAMTLLENDPAMRTDAGDKYLEMAKGDQVYYAAALREYEEAIKLSPSSVDALNGYAYTFWQWRLRYPLAVGDGRRPTLEVGTRAEAAARKAVALVAGRVPPPAEAMSRGTLGEVLLGLSRPEEAIEQLEKALTFTTDHASYDEIRWDLAQAYKCASVNDEIRKLPVSRIRDLRVKAARHLEIIRGHENERGLAVFSSKPSLLDPGTHQDVCTRDATVLLETRPTAPVPYALETTAYGPYYLCAGLAVVAKALDLQGRPVPGLALHTWGGDVDRWVDAARGEPAFLSSAPRDGHDYYFVQLFARRADDSVEAVSLVYSLTTFANGKDGSCSSNQINLVFRQIR